MGYLPSRLAAAVIFAVLAMGAAPPPQARLDTGVVTGVGGPMAEAFLGVPYAAPPVGALRWAPPQPAKAWPGVRPATASATACSALPSGDGPRIANEDCLYLNVYRPAGAKAGARLPVMVFLHGGGNVSGSPGIYDGSRMAAVGKAVVVIPAYRFGVFGALAPPAAGAQGGSYTLLDAMAALKWVTRNAAALGGDSADVTVLGQSAGGGNVCALVVSPAAAGLFRQAIIESSGCGARRPLAAAQADARALAAKLGCADADLACLRRQSTDALLDAWSGSSAPPFGTEALPEDPPAAFAAGHFNPVPLLIGFTHDEWWPFEHGLYPLSEAGYRAKLQTRFGAKAAAAAARYRPADFLHVEYAFGAAEGDQRMICPSLALAARIAGVVPVSVYQFADRSTPPFKSLGPPQPIPPGYQPGAFHTAELQFILGYQSATRPLDTAQQARGDDLIRRWVAFGRGRGWPAYPTVQRFDETGASLETAAAVAADHRCDLWAS